MLYLSSAPLINIFNVFSKNKYELKWLASFP